MVMKAGMSCWKDFIIDSIYVCYAEKILFFIFVKLIQGSLVIYLLISFFFYKSIKIRDRVCYSREAKNNVEEKSRLDDLMGAKIKKKNK